MCAIPGLNALGLGDYYTFCTFTYTLLVVSMNYRVAFLTTTWNRYSILFELFSFISYTGFLLAVITQEAGFMHGAPLMVLSCKLFWLCVFAMLALAFATDLAKWYLLDQFAGVRMESVLRDVQKKKGEKKKGDPAMAEEGQRRESESSERWDEAERIKFSFSGLNQQTLVLFSFTLSGRKVKFLLLGLGLLLVGLGHYAKSQ